MVIDKNVIGRWVGPRFYGHLFPSRVYDRLTPTSYAQARHDGRIRIRTIYEPTDIVVQRVTVVVKRRIMRYNFDLKWTMTSIIYNIKASARP